jgi:hypothetical protein
MLAISMCQDLHSRCHWWQSHREGRVLLCPLGIDIDSGDQSSIDMTCLTETEKQFLPNAGYQFDNDTR